MNKRTIALILILTALGQAKTRPPALDPNVCPSPYDPNILEIAWPMAWMPADVNISVVSTINTWNKSGREVAVKIEQVDFSVTPPIQPIEATLLPDTEAPVPDPNGGYNRSWSWGFTPKTAKIYYLLFTAWTPTKPHWQQEKRVILVYVEPQDVPILWVQNVTEETMANAQRVWQAAQKTEPMTKPTLVRLAQGD